MAGMTLSHMQEVQDNVSHSNSSLQTTTILAQQSALSHFKSGLSVKDSLKLITKWVFSCASCTLWNVSVCLPFKCRAQMSCDATLAL